MARDVEVVVRRGESADIVLRGSAGTISQIDFRLRSQPEHGKLGEPVPQTSNTAVVRYQNDGDKQIFEDRFRYAVQSPGSPWSAAATVHITIQHPAPALEIPERVDFGTTTIGIPIRRVLKVRNCGGGVATGTAWIDRPFSIEGERNFSLAENEEKSFDLIFDPDWAGPATSLMTFAGFSKSSIQTTGTALVPIEVSPDHITLVERAVEDSATALQISNNRREPVKIKLERPSGVLLPEFVTVSGGQTSIVPVRRDPRHMEAIRAPIGVSLGDFRVEIPVAAPALPGRLTVVPSTRIQLGEIENGETMRSIRFSLKNEGGLPLDIRVIDSMELRRITPESSFILIPSGQRDIAFEASLPDSGIFRREASIVSGTMSIPIVIDGTVHKPLPKATPASGPIGEAEQSNKAPAWALELATGRLKILSYKTRPHSVSLEWKDPVPGRESYRYYLGHTVLVNKGGGDTGDAYLDGLKKAIRLDEGEKELATQWLPIRPVKSEIREGGVRSVLLEGLPGGGMAEIKIEPINLDGQPSRVAEIVRLPMPYVEPFWNRKTKFIAALLGLAICIGLIFRQRMRA